MAGDQTALRLARAIIMICLSIQDRRIIMFILVLGGLTPRWAADTGR